jgi:FkbM family methyltransferase
MRLLLAKIFRFLFTCRFFRKRYYGIVFRIFQPLNLFRGVTEISSYDKNLKMKLDLDEWIQQHIYFLGYFDPRGIRYIKNQLYEGEVFVDIGANVGAYSLIASKLVGRTGKVIAFEPASKSFLRLTKNISMNGLTNIISERKAVLNRNAQIELYISNRQNMGMSSIFHHDSESGVTERVEAISLDEYAEKKNIQRISVVKIDIEGSEMLALRGMVKIIEKFRPRILIELKEETVAASNYRVVDIEEFLINTGYEKYIINEQGNVSNDLKRQSKDYHNYLFLPVNS